MGSSSLMTVEALGSRERRRWEGPRDKFRVRGCGIDTRVRRDVRNIPGGEAITRRESSERERNNEVGDTHFGQTNSPQLTTYKLHTSNCHYTQVQ